MEAPRGRVDLRDEAAPLVALHARAQAIREGH